MGSVRKRMAWTWAGLLAALGAMTLFWGRSSSDGAQEASAARDRDGNEPLAPLRSADVPLRARGDRVAPNRADRAPVPEVNTRPSIQREEIPSRSFEVVGPHPHDRHEPGMVPHPLDEVRSRIASENRLIQSLNDAMSFRRVGKMRELLKEYRELDPSDVEAHQLGYEVIADCIEFPGDPSLTAAREFYDTQRHSPLRRFVRRICFENERRASTDER